MSFNDIVEEVSSEFEKIMKTCGGSDELELEVRLGIFDQDNNRFDSNIGEDHFCIIDGILDKFTRWDNVKHTNTIDRYNKNLRYTTDTKTKNVTCIKKDRLASFTYTTEQLPFDFRFSISRETKVSAKGDTPSGHSRDKSRTSRCWQNASIDMTRVMGSTKMGHKEETFEFEVEHSGPITDIRNNVYQIFYKCMDANYMCDGFIRKSGMELPLEAFSYVKV